jgi:hypothetical protein
VTLILKPASIILSITGLTSGTKPAFLAIMSKANVPLTFIEKDLAHFFAAPSSIIAVYCGFE